MRIWKTLAAIALAVALPCLAQAQTAPGWTYAQVPTPAQWNAVFAGKQDYLGAPPLLVTGGTMTGPLVTAASALGAAGLNLPPGAAPTSPNNGDFWSTSSGFYGRVNGVTVGPFVGAGSSTVAATAPLAVSFPSSVVTYALNFNTSLVNTGGNLGINLAHSNAFSAAQSVSLNAAALPAGQTGTIFQVGGADGTSPRIEIDGYGTGNTTGVPRFTCVRSDGTNASPTTLQSGDESCSFNAFGYNGSAVAGPQAAIRMYAAANWTTTSNGTYVRISTTATSDAGHVLTDRLGIEQDGGIVTLNAGALPTGGDKGIGTINAAGLIYSAGNALATSASSPLALNATTGALTCATCVTSSGGGAITGTAPIVVSAAGVVSVTASALTQSNDTNVTITLGGSPSTSLLAATSLTMGWTGQLGLTRGGTNASLTASNGGLVYSTGSALAILNGTVTANQIPLSGSSTAPAWSTATYPGTASAGTVLAAGSANVISATATPTLGVQQTTQGKIVLANTAAGAFATTVQSSNSASAAWTLTLPVTAGTSGYVLQTDGAGVLSWVNPSGGTVTSVTCGTGLTGGTFTTIGTCAIDYTRANTWTGLNTFTATIAVPGTTIGIGVPQTFVGSGGTGDIWVNQTGVASSATVPEIGGQFTLASNTGLANAGSAFKIGLTSSVVGGANSANVFGFNSITQGYAGTGGYLVTGNESDINNVGANANTLGAATSAYAFVAVAAGAFQSTAAYWATASSGGQWTYGFATSNTNASSIKTADFHSASNATAVLDAVGTHTNGIDLSGATISGAQIKATGFSVDSLGNATYAGTSVAFSGSTYVVGPSIFQNGGILTFAGGTSGYTWDNQAIGINLMTLSNAGALRLNQYAAGVVQTDASGNITNTSAATLPQGRLTLTSGVPVLTSNVLGATTIYYTNYLGSLVPIYDGVNFTLMNCPELSNVLANSSVGNAGPAAVGASSDYDLFVWNNSGTCALTRGPVWTNDTTRSAGTALVSQNGIWLNNANITNGPAASRGTYVGSFRTNASSQIDWNLGTLSSTAQQGWLGFWNAYNRINVVAVPQDQSASWVVSSTSTWEPANNAGTHGSQNRVSFIVGLAQQNVVAEYMVNVTSTPTGYIGTCFDCTNNGNSVVFQVSATGTPQSKASYYPAIGFHYIQATEYATNAATAYAGNTAEGLFVTTEQ